MNKQVRTLTASTDPLADIHKITPIGQPPRRRDYRAGYEEYFNGLMLIDPNDPDKQVKLKFNDHMMSALARNIKSDNWLQRKDQRIGEFARTILALASPTGTDSNIKENEEILVAHWGTGFSSPVHGHGPGMLHETILTGKVRVNTYRMINQFSNTVRLISTTIAEPGLLISDFKPIVPAYFKRPHIIHNFVALEPSHTLHYLSEHTRDGRDNTFTPEYFETEYALSPSDVQRISIKEAMYAYPGEVILVRSSNVQEYGDHYVVITGMPVQKKHGLRPQEISLEAPKTGPLLDSYEPITGVVLLKLKKEAREAFYEFHGIRKDGNHIVFPEPDALPL